MKSMLWLPNTFFQTIAKLRRFGQTKFRTRRSVTHSLVGLYLRVPKLFRWCVVMTTTYLPHLLYMIVENENFHLMHD